MTESYFTITWPFINKGSNLSRILISPKFQQVMMLRIAVSALFYAGFRVGMTEHPAPLTGHSADSSKRLLPQAA